MLCCTFFSKTTRCCFPRCVSSCLAKFIFPNIRVVLAFAFLYKMREERPVEPYKCLSAHLITLADENKLSMPVLFRFSLNRQPSKSCFLSLIRDIVTLFTLQSDDFSPYIDINILFIKLAKGVINEYNTQYC